ncbi:fucose 4-O-acetylase-like acetyltransferase [Streptomyces sp. LBL]|uniref:acyltransferase family protein n=1 Tax=Streptomyces sp. LBL TaxID=2940562 RepID=UPI0024753F45|nr:acyltransferase family protein [Streptomyces sp. LBL]MDH6623393.1 fucose 4-O-acetylase-like acetyltransferase [Streptomyces sp. LBL]
MTNPLRPHGQNRAPLPPAQSSADGVPSPRSPRNHHGEQASSRPSTGGTSAGTRPGKERDAFFDNAKYLAIVLVAVGHSWEPIKGDSRILESLYTVVYSFHMPAFIIISGFFSRSFDLRADRLKRLLTGVVVPYVVFETAYSLFKRFVDHAPGQEISLLDPWYLTWFLCALFIWRLTTPIWKLVRWPLPIALGVAMLASVSPEIGDDLDLQRVLQFLPFFVLGLCMKPEHFRLVRRRSVRILSVPVFAAALAVGWWAVPRMNTAWFYHRDAAQELAAPWWSGPVMVLVLFGCSVLLTACFFAWVPGRTMWFTALGAGTLYGYLLHGFLIKAGEFGNWFDHAWLKRPLGEIFVSVLAAAVVTLLCTPPVRRVFRCVMEPTMEWAFKRDSADVTRGRGKRGTTEQSALEREKVNA